MFGRLPTVTPCCYEGNRQLFNEILKELRLFYENRKRNPNYLQQSEKLKQLYNEKRILLDKIKFQGNNFFVKIILLYAKEIPTNSDIGRNQQFCRDSLFGEIHHYLNKEYGIKNNYSFADLCRYIVIGLALANSFNRMERENIYKTLHSNHLDTFHLEESIIILARLNLKQAILDVITEFSQTPAKSELIRYVCGAAAYGFALSENDVNVNWIMEYGAVNNIEFIGGETPLNEAAKGYAAVGNFSRVNELLHAGANKAFSTKGYMSGGYYHKVDDTVAVNAAVEFLTSKENFFDLCRQPQEARLNDNPFLRIITNINSSKLRKQFLETVEKQGFAVSSIEKLLSVANTINIIQKNSKMNFDDAYQHICTAVKAHVAVMHSKRN